LIEIALICCIIYCIAMIAFLRHWGTASLFLSGTLAIVGLAVYRYRLMQMAMALWVTVFVLFWAGTASCIRDYRLAKKKEIEEQIGRPTPWIAPDKRRPNG